MVHKIKTLIPTLTQVAFIAHSAEVAGDVSLGKDTSVWFSATVRGDIAPIIIGDKSNVQDNVVIHCGTDIPCIIGEGVTLGHGAILHSCTIGNNSLIGMGAIILDKAIIKEDSIVGAGSLVPQNKEYPPRSLILGSPAKFVRYLSDEEVAHNRKNALHYVEIAKKVETDYKEIEI